MVKKRGKRAGFGKKAEADVGYNLEGDSSSKGSGRRNGRNDSRNNESGGDFIFVLLVIFALFVIALAFYYFYLDTGINTGENLDVLFKPPVESQGSNLPVQQFYPNMKFNHNQLSYTLGGDCSD